MKREAGRVGIALWACLVLGAIAGCGTKYVSTKQPDAQLITAHAPEEVRAAVLRALVGMKGLAQTESETGGAVLARLGKEDSYARIAIEYAPTQYRIRYLESHDLKTKPGADGDVLVEKKYATLEHRLRGQIDSELGRPAREAAASEKNRRDYEALMQQSRTAQAQADAQAASATDTPDTPDTAPAAVAPASPRPSFGAYAGAIAGAAATNITPPTVQLGGSVRRSEQSLTCCINGARYKCPGQDAFNQCVRSGPSRCTPAGHC